MQCQGLFLCWSFTINMYKIKSCSKGPCDCGPPSGSAKKKHEIACKGGSERHGPGGAVGFWGGRKAWGWSSWSCLLSGRSRHSVCRSLSSLVTRKPMIFFRPHFFHILRKAILSHDQPLHYAFQICCHGYGSSWACVHPCCFSILFLTIISMSTTLQIQVLEILLSLLVIPISIVFHCYRMVIIWIFLCCFFFQIFHKLAAGEGKDRSTSENYLLDHFFYHIITVASLLSYLWCPRYFIHIIPNFYTVHIN